jgi:lipoprotein-anchoring transpeptidase ErfK/SrfK
LTTIASKTIHRDNFVICREPGFVAMLSASRQSGSIEMICRLVIGAIVAVSYVAATITDASAQFRPGNYGNDPVANFFGFGGGSSGGSPIARTTVSFPANYKPGTIVIRSGERRLYLVLGNGQALSYGIGVGRDGFGWSGVKRISAKREWPAWTPPAQMLRRRPDLPRHMAGGPDNPLGARALYLGKTLYRIHGTNQPSTIGTFVSSGCIRLTNDDIADLYQQVKVGTRVVVLPGRPPASANPAPEQPSGPYNPLAPPRTR